jgi:hypothetical protein
MTDRRHRFAGIDKRMTKVTALAFMRSLSGFITPPGKSSASNWSAPAEARGTLTGTFLPHFFSLHAYTLPSSGDTMLILAPAASRAFLRLEQFRLLEAVGDQNRNTLSMQVMRRCQGCVGHFLELPFASFSIAIIAERSVQACRRGLGG